MPAYIPCMLAVKLKLVPTKEQYLILNEMFWKWASICNRIGAGTTLEELSPREVNTLQFSKTQLNQANTDVSDLKNALAKRAKQLKYEMGRVEARYNAIKECINQENAQDVDPNNRKLFRPKSWVTSGLLKSRFHTMKYWKGQLEKIGRLIERRKNTIAKIEKGGLVFKPKRISLHPNAIQFNFGESKVVLKPFAKEGSSGIKDITINFLSTPVQAARGSSLKSNEFLHGSVKKYISYAINQSFFGLNRAEEMLLKAKAPEKVARKEERLKNKMALSSEKIKALSKMLGRDLTDTETTLIEKELARFFADVPNYAPSLEYLEKLAGWSEEVLSRKDIVSFNKYPILIRMPINRYSHKKIVNLKPEEWEYFIQISYEPLFIPTGFSERTVLGIDRGVSHLLAVSIYDPASNKFSYNKLISNPIAKWKMRRRNLMKAIANLERKVRAQHNIHLHENQMKKRIRSIEDKVENLLHNVSKGIVNLARANNSVIVMERLREMRQHGRKKSRKLKNLNYTLSLFDYAKIGMFIRYKAQKDGIPVYEIDPAGTSQNCAKCLIEGSNGEYIRGVDNNMKIGKCNLHGQIDADLNAARTIAVCYHKKLNNPERVA